MKSESSIQLKILFSIQILVCIQCKQFRGKKGDTNNTDAAHMEKETNYDKN